MRNAFNILANDGFLRSQGILSLESVQEFYKTIKEEPKNATMRVANLLDFCNQPGFNEPDHLPVITLTKTDSRTGEVQAHAVVLSDYTRYEDALVLTTIDSASQAGETMIECPISEEHEEQKLKTDESEDKWCLGSEMCYYLFFN